MNNKTTSHFRQWVLAAVGLMACSTTVQGQNTMQIHYSDGKVQRVPIAQVDSISFTDEGEIENVTVKLACSWLWADVEAGYYELLTLGEDGAFTCYDHFFSYGYETTTYGRYTLRGTLLTLLANGPGYSRRNEWFVTGLSANALEVRTRLGAFVYYRLQPDVIRLRVGETWADDNGMARFVFADEEVAGIADGKLKGLSPGTTYVQKQLTMEGDIVSYKLIVEAK